MIVDPDFLDHWRTGMVRDALADEMAPVYILRLWAHCQERKSDTFVMPTKGLKAQCKFPGDADAFEAALIDAGFLERDGATLRVLGWAEKNASLLAAWENGSKGGRPRKEPKENPRVTQEEPTGNPAVTHGEPIANPSLTHAKPIREEKSREEKNSRADALFDSFWSAYPKKKAKDDALKAFSKRKPDAELLSRMLSAIKAQSASEDWLKDGGKFIPYPATWLNDARWEDEETAIEVPSSGSVAKTDDYLKERKEQEAKATKPPQFILDQLKGVAKPVNKEAA